MNPLSPSPMTAPEVPRAQPASRRLWGLVIAGLGVAAITIWLVAFYGKKDANGHGEQTGNKKPSTSVDIIYPQPGGIDRVCIQPGTVEPYESADLYAKASGFLIETVDIGTKVEENQILARISVPEYEQQVHRDTAKLAHANAAVKQMDAHLLAAQSEERATKQMIAQSKIEMKSKAVYRSYRFKQLARIQKLYDDKAVDAKYLDETTDHYEASFEAENAAKEAITTSELKWETAKARVLQAEADLKEAEANVDVAKAELEKAKVLLSYTFIKSPYKGVVTKRNFNRGDFIRSAETGNDRVPVVAVDRTDLMRIIVQVPDRDVPYVDKGDAAIIEIDALPDRKPLKGVIARAANAEDTSTRTMRTEIDIPNTDGKLRRNMYGRVKLTLQVGSPTALRIPAAALMKREDGVQPTVRVLRNNRVLIVPVDIGVDTGVEVEILRGLQLIDQVIMRGNGPLDEGTEIAEVHEMKGAAPH